MSWQQRAHEQLYALQNRLRIYDGCVADLRDNELHVTRWQPGSGDRRETITCSPRPSDGDRLWFWTSDREPIAEADKIIDAALMIASLFHSSRSSAH